MTVYQSDIKLYLGDCLDILPTLEDNSVDVVFADPPFNINKKYGDNGNDNRKDYYEWCGVWIYECFRVLKDTGTFYLMTIDRHLEKKFPMMGQHGVFINLIKWRNVSASHSKRNFWNSTQPILMYGKTKDYKFNTYAERRHIKLENRRWGGYSTKPQGQLLDYWDDIPFIYAGSAAHSEAIIKPRTNEKAHPTQMPIGLAIRAITFSSDEDDIVLDCFFGSGTTGVACVQTGRNFIGIEIEPKYYDIAEKRIKEAQRQMVMAI
jgi:site-specific DNA-methyltransferase (adenine-specific)